MNKSIAKTRNELERITYKINQLKTKYTGESYPHGTNVQNSPLQQSYKQQYSDQRNSINDQIVVSKGVQPMNTNYNLGNSNLKNNGYYDEVYQKEFKVFRSQIYSYVDKCLIMGKEREQEAIERAVQAYMGTSRSASKQNTEREGRIKKIEEETTSCLTSLQDVLAQVKKNQKAIGQKLASTEIKIRRELNELREKLQSMEGNPACNHEQQIDKRIAQIQKEYGQQRESRIREAKSANKVQQELQRELKQTQMAIKRLEERENALRQSSVTTNRIVSLESKLQSMDNLESSFKEMEAKVSKKVQEIESKQKQSQKSLFEQLIHIKEELRQALPEPENLINQAQSKIQASYLKPRLEQIKRQLTTKMTQEIQFNKQEILINVDETIFEKISKFLGQEKQRKSPKMDLEESKIALKQELKDIEVQLKNLVQEQIEEKVEKHLAKNNVKIQNLETSFNISNRQKTLDEEQSESKRTQEIVENKLNQFQTDINETIKLLYEDIQSRVNEMLSHSGISQLKVEMESIKKQIKDIETRMKSLTLIATTNSVPTHSGPNLQFFQSLRSQVYTDMGCQIDKISNILQRTVEQMEGKVEKLDRNFTYVYDRMSKIEFDNANFKDQLAQRVVVHGVNIIEKKKVESVPKIKTDNPLLDALGQYNAGGYFFESA